MRFKLLVVCTGNICRSPMAEHLLRHGLQERLGPAAHDFVVASAGTLGLVDQPMEPFAADLLRGRYQVDGSAFRAKVLEAFMVQGADLVLTAARDHRAAAVTLHPPAARKTFTIREFDRLLSVLDPATLPVGDPVERAKALVGAAASQRGLVRAEQAEDDDITDPYRGPFEGYETCATLLHAALQRPLDLIAG